MAPHLSCLPDTPNVDFCGGKSVPFTQYQRPDGRPVAQWIDQGPDGIDFMVVRKARAVVAAGFFFAMEELATGEAVFSITNNDGDFAVERCPNGPQVPGIVRKLILEADIEKMSREWMLTGFTRTDDVISEAALRELFTMEADDDLEAGPHQVCAGAWIAEPGEPRTWRFYADPECDDEGETELADADTFVPRPDLDL